MRPLSPAFAMLVVALAPHASAQCPPASTYEGFHQENVGSALAAQGHEAVFGHYSGFNVGIHEPLPNEYWWRVALVGGNTTNPKSMGSAVAMRGDVVALGDPVDASLFGGFGSHGALAIIERNGGVWANAATFFPPTPTSGIGFGTAVAVSDDQSRVAVSAPWEGGTGVVHIYTRVAGTWTGPSSLAPASLGASAVFGAWVHFQGGRLFVGATNQGVGGTVYVFEQPSGAWVEAAQLTPSGAQANEQFGARIKGAGDTLFVSVPGRSGPTGTGKVVRFDRVGSSWVEGASIVPAWPNPVLSFGRGLDYEGGRLAAGGIGYAGVFVDGGTAGWTPIAQFTYPDAVTYSDFGKAVALHTDGLLVGAPQYDGNGFDYPDNTGAVHAYDLSDVGQSLIACGHAIDLSAAGGEHLLLDAPALAHQPFVILGSATGTGPTFLSGVNVPLTVDPYLLHTISSPGGATLPGGLGLLDAAGRAEADFTLPAGLPAGLAGTVVQHAFVTWAPGVGATFASNAVGVTLVP